MKKRTDIHRPSAIIPEDYEFVAFEHIKSEGIGDAEEVLANRKMIQHHMARTGGFYSQHEHGGNCMICGNALAIYTILFYHAKTNTYVRVGQDCAQKLDMSYGDFNKFTAAIRDAREAQAGKRKAQALLADAGLSKAWELYVADMDALPVDKTRPRYIYNEDNSRVQDGFYILADVLTVRSMVGNLVKYGSMTEKAQNYLGILLKRIEDKPTLDAQRQAERDAAAPCPKGRVTVTGTVLKTSWHETQFGTTLKMTVKAKEGYIVWVTVPSGMSAERGTEVTFTATLTPSDNDPKFGFGKRPTFKTRGVQNDKP